jgi:predicted DNA-binding protein (MmcQ/YjbR family)
MEKVAWGEPTWRTTGKDGRIFAMFAKASTHHGFGKNAVWLKCTATNQEFILRDDSQRYFKPPYVGPHGWIGVYLDGRTKWSALASLIEDAHALALPRKKSRGVVRKTSRGLSPKTS